MTYAGRQLTFRQELPSQRGLVTPGFDPKLV
jgi:hypothetical protein